MDALERDLLLKIADLHGIPEGAYNIRENGKPAGRRSTEHIEIASRKDGKSGIDIDRVRKTKACIFPSF